MYARELSNGGGHVSRESTIGTTKSYDRTYEYHNVEKCKFHQHTTRLLPRGSAFSTLCVIININSIVSFVLPTGSGRYDQRSGHSLGGLTFFGEHSIKLRLHLHIRLYVHLHVHLHIRVIWVQVTHAQDLAAARRLRYSTGS